MLLREMQTLLARCYDAPSEYDVYDFLTTDRGDLGLPTGCSDEQVLIAEQGDCARVGVFIDANVLQRLAERDPMQALNDENLADYCTAFEGVSHFHYFTWRAAQRLPVSLLELELQAEVDKYVGAMVLLTQQQSGRYPSHLHRRLFAGVSFAHGLEAESLSRYRLANRNAAQFCRKLDDRYLHTRRRRPELWLGEVRRFYRYGHAEKVRRAEA